MEFLFTMIQKQRQPCFAWLMMLWIVWGTVGCRVLRQRGADQQMAGARQLSLRGADALDRDRFQDAELLFSEALQCCPTDERAHWGYAQTLWQKGSKQEAIRHMQEAIRISGTDPEYMVRLGEMYLSIGDLPNAAQQAQLAISEDHRNPQAWSLLGDTHRSMKNWEQALTCYQRAMLLQPDYPEVQLATADIYRQLGRPQRALATLDRMVDLHPTEHSKPESLMVRGLALADMGHQREALAVLNRAADKMPLENVDQHVQLATAQYRLGDLVQARMSLGKALQASPAHAEAKRLQSTLDLSFEHLAQPIMASDQTLLR